jgi:hypothetical protein
MTDKPEAVQSMTSGDVFLDQIMRAIVQQFFEAPQIIVYPTSTDQPYIPPPPQRSTPVQVVTERLLTDKQAELLDAIMEKIDLDALAEGVAAKVSQTLLATDPTRPSYGWTKTEQAQVRARQELRERIDSRLVELLAQDMFASIKSAEPASRLRSEKSADHA